MSSDPLVHALFSCNSSWSLSTPPGRKAASAAAGGGGGGGVPPTTEGLRILAAEGSWAEVLELATNLEREILQTAPRVPLLLSNSSAGTTTTAISKLQQQQQQQQASAATVPQYDSAILQLVLARVTAYIKMNDFSRANQLLENVPWHMVAEAEIPFSLVFLRSFVPMMLPQAGIVEFSRVQSRLYSLLMQIETQLGAALANDAADAAAAAGAGGSSSGAAGEKKVGGGNVVVAAAVMDVPTSLLEHRRFRVARAIVANHIRLQETAPAIDVLQRMAEYHAQRRKRVQAAAAVILLSAPPPPAVNESTDKSNNNSSDHHRSIGEDEAKKKEALQTIVYENVFLTSPAITKDRTGFSGGGGTLAASFNNVALDDQSPATTFNEDMFPSASMVFSPASAAGSPGTSPQCTFIETSGSGGGAHSLFSPYERQQMQKMIDVATMEEMLCLQQAMCLALYSGNAPLSHQLRKKAEDVLHRVSSTSAFSSSGRVKNNNNKSSSSNNNTLRSSTTTTNTTMDSTNNGGAHDEDDDEDEEEVMFGPEPWHLKDLMMCLNDSLLDVFFDRPADAAARLSAVVGGFLIDGPSTTTGAGTVLPSLAPPLAKPSAHVIAAQRRALPIGSSTRILRSGDASLSLTTTTSKIGDTSSSGSDDDDDDEQEDLESTAVRKLHLSLPYYLAPARSLHVQYQFLSVCLTLISLVPHVLHAPPSAASQRAPASMESRRPQSAVDTATLCNAALDRLVTCYPAIALRMPGVMALINEVRTAMAGDMASARRILYQTVLSHLIAGRESVQHLAN